MRTGEIECLQQVAEEALSDPSHSSAGEEPVEDCLFDEKDKEVVAVVSV